MSILTLKVLCEDWFKGVAIGTDFYLLENEENYCENE
jgi:hypothetical protein